MPADLKNPFGPSCCDGGECPTAKESARPCGCDPGANWLCQQHQIELVIAKAQKVPASPIGRFASGLQLDDDDE